MSWLFAISGAHTPQSYFHSIPDWTLSTDNFYLAVGGNPDTSIWESNVDNSSGWAVVGIGIRRTTNRFSILTRDEWREILTREVFDVAALDGHFVALRWRSDTLECFTDQLGLRLLYFSKYDKGICISTRLDWVAQTTSHSTIDFAALGSRWLLFNQLTYDSCLQGIERLGPAGHAIFKDGEVIRSVTYDPWRPQFESQTSSHALEMLQGLVACAQTHPKTVSLGLSGGTDSRLLLALLAKNPDTTFVTHTFGNAHDPDVKIARGITATLGIAHQHFDDPIPTISQCIAEMHSFVAQTILVEPSSSYLKLRYYPKLREAGWLMIDGGFGEIARRQYLNRVVKLGRRALRSRDSVRLLQLMRSQRADIFSAEITAVMVSGARQSLEKTLDEMPAVESIGVENFADLLAVRTRIPNYGGPEQSRLDAEILNFMPLVQPSFLHAAFGLPINVRANAGLYYGIIRKECPPLTRFPLVKSGLTYPFGLSSIASWLTVKVKSKLARPYFDRNPDLLLSNIREYVFDLAHSSDVKTNPMYDFPKVSNAVSKYYAGDLRFRNTVDWWLTFELWKRSLSIQALHARN